ncbi:hypothetical protein EHEL_090530 [Encephalitozoon hellem ATCC 50504]|uniref:DUF5097 domain-containing protein n=1 Tax=Encephalitozoon hellem TaxID=27973 RepID=A0A9Q9C7F4_ENCHE|nr:uncharacterized protein EHEL_090530 [Encephalitozoon hellem ATCC 50504]AFM98948.2 hypothetical protein EHEL_090530 [Encephalitozoon hellem ATCC 50504]UTX43962.1 DUF5097 domain-containing protein [Encephalitozoon hellem]
MIESSAIKKFIINYFIEHSQEDIDKMAGSIHSYILKGFLMNELVCNMKSGKYGRISKVGGGRYTMMIQSDNGEHEESCYFSDLARKDDVSASGIKGYLLGITMETPFGRVLKENAFRSIKDSTEVVRCKVPQNQCHGAMRSSSKDSLRPLDREKRQEMVPCSEGGENQNKLSKMWDGGSKAMEARNNRVSERPDIGLILNMGDGQMLRIPGFGSSEVELMIKIFGVLMNFRSFFGIERIGVKGLGDAIIDPLYESDIISRTHENLIEMLNAEINSIGMDVFIENSRPCMMLASESLRFLREKKQDTHEGTGNPSKPRGPRKKNWKPELEKFVEKISDQAGIDISYIIPCVFAKDCPLSQEEIRSRLVLLELLLNMFFTTELFREAISEKMKESKELERKKRVLQIGLKRSGPQSSDAGAPSDIPKASEARKELADTMEKIFRLPTSIEIGEIAGIRFLNLDKRIYAVKEGDYYPLSRDALFSLCKKYHSKSKSEKNVLASIEHHVEILESYP